MRGPGSCKKLVRCVHHLDPHFIDACTRISIQNADDSDSGHRVVENRAKKMIMNEAIKAEN
jgi:hypothetical protein